MLKIAICINSSTCSLKGKKNSPIIFGHSISLTSNTIDDGTGSEGQSIEIVNVAPKKAWTTTGKRNLDFDLAIPDDMAATDVATLVNKFFAQVVTPDNASEVLA